MGKNQANHQEKELSHGDLRFYLVLHHKLTTIDGFYPERYTQFCARFLLLGQTLRVENERYPTHVQNLPEDEVLSVLDF
jgi:hypothetical protein